MYRSQINSQYPQFAGRRDQFAAQRDQFASQYPSAGMRGQFGQGQFAGQYPGQLPQYPAAPPVEEFRFPQAREFMNANYPDYEQGAFRTAARSAAQSYYDQNSGEIVLPEPVVGTMEGLPYEVSSNMSEIRDGAARRDHIVSYTPVDTIVERVQPKIVRTIARDDISYGVPTETRAEIVGETRQARIPGRISFEEVEEIPMYNNFRY